MKPRTALLRVTALLLLCAPCLIAAPTPLGKLLVPGSLQHARTRRRHCHQPGGGNAGVSSSRITSSFQRHRAKVKIGLALTFAGLAVVTLVA